MRRRGRRSQKTFFGKFRDRSRTEIGIEIGAKTKKLKTAKVRDSSVYIH